ncbi:MAG: cobalamin-binding protein [Ignavibacteria bacterium]|nr:cobalamin-binding protein [Ignavibacteria bacterium]
MNAPRVVSLLSSATEIVCELGCIDRLVGRSHECDHPAGILKLPVCTGPKFDTAGTSKEIDTRVKETLAASPEEALSVYAVDAELLRSLQPDVILTQSQCEVCAVSLKDVERAVCTWISSETQLVALEPHCLADVWDDIRAVAGALNVQEDGERLIERLQSDLRSVEARVASFVPPTVACIEWIDPLMTAGNWTPELIQIAGGENLFGKAGSHSPWMSWEDLRRADPDVIVVAPCGFDLERTRRESGTLAEQPGWSGLSAVKNRRVHIADGNRFFNRPGPGLIETTQILTEMFHPGVIESGLHGTAWERLR